MFSNLKEKVKGNFSKIALGATTCGVLITNTVMAHAEDTDVSTITGQISTALSDSKTQFVTALGSIVVVAVGFFIVKFVVRQVIGYFAKIASK